MSLIKYIKFDYKNNNYNFIQCWQSKFKIFNIDFIENKRLDYIKINNLSINNDFYHNNKEDYQHEYYNKCTKKVLLDNNLIKNINKFNIDIKSNKITVDDVKLINNDYMYYNYNIEKILSNDEYKNIKKLIFSNLYKYAKYNDINNIRMTVNNNKRRYNSELKEEGFIIDNNLPTNDDENLNIILKI
jgi:hypothetical protein